MKKVLFLMYSLGAGGAERILVDTVNLLPKEKYDITVQTLFHEETRSRMLDQAVHYRTVFRIKSGWLKKLVSGVVQYLLPPALVYRLLVRQQYDVEAAFMESFPTKILAYSTNRRAKKYTWVHIDMNQYTRQDRLYRSLAHQRSCYEKFDSIYCVSEEVKDAFIKKMGPMERIHTVYNILDEELIRRKSRESEITRENPFVLVSVGSLVPRKGFERLIRICSRLKNEGMDFQLWILGDGPQKQELCELVQTENLTREVKLLGFLENPYPYIAASDLYVCASYAEGFSTVVCEAMILQIPAVTTECAGMREILGDSEYGVVTDNEEEALYQGMRRLIADKEYYEHYRQKAMERSGFFSVKKRLQEYEDILDQ